MSVPEGVVQGNNLDVLTSIPDDSIDLIYIDPPFGTGKAQTMKRIATGQGDQTRLGYGGKSYNFEEVSRLSYADNMPFDDYLEFLYVRLAEMHRVLTPSGSLYLHLDYRTTHYARFMMDEIFGADRFLNEIIWSYDYGGRHKDRWPRKHDSIFGMPRVRRGRSTETKSIAFPTWRPAWLHQKRPNAESYPLTCGG